MTRQIGDRLLVGGTACEVSDGHGRLVSRTPIEAPT
jgi:hypothetical protein